MAIRRVGLLNRKFGIDETSKVYEIGVIPVDEAVPDHQVIEINTLPRKVQVSKLQNGVSVLTETSSFPNLVYIGALYGIGVRDETLEFSGSLLHLKQTHLRSSATSDEQAKYGNIQLSGGDLSMDYTEELSFYQGYCLAEDTHQYLQMMSECLFHERSLQDQEIAHKRVEQHWKTQEANFTNENKLKEMMLQTAFGIEGLGLPLLGVQSNYWKINSDQINEFRRTRMTPDNLLVYAAGVESHEEFVEVVTPFFENLSSNSTWNRTPEKFIGGDQREKCESELVYINLGFEGLTWTDEEMTTLQVLKTAVGEGGGFSSGGPGKGMHTRSYTHFLMKYPFLDSVTALNLPFTDTGIFGVTVSGIEKYGHKIIDCLVAELKALGNLTDIEIHRAKNLFKGSMLRNLEKTEMRIEDIAKGYVLFGKVPEEKTYYIEMIDRVTPNEVRALAEKMLKRKPSLVVLGADPGKVPSLDKIAQNLNEFKDLVE